MRHYSVELEYNIWIIDILNCEECVRLNKL